MWMPRFCIWEHELPRSRHGKRQPADFGSRKMAAEIFHCGRLCSRRELETNARARVRNPTDGELTNTLFLHWIFHFPCSRLSLSRREQRGRLRKLPSRSHETFSVFRVCVSLAKAPICVCAPVLKLHWLSATTNATEFRWHEKSSQCRKEARMNIPAWFAPAKSKPKRHGRETSWFTKALSVHRIFTSSRTSHLRDSLLAGGSSAAEVFLGLASLVKMRCEDSFAMQWRIADGGYHLTETLSRHDHMKKIQQFTEDMPKFLWAPSTMKNDAAEQGFRAWLTEAPSSEE